MTSGAPHVQIASAPPRIFHLDIPAIWTFLKQQPASFWLINIYLFFEYVRPHQVWPSLDILPWAQTALLGSVVAMLLEQKPLKVVTPAGFCLMFFTIVLVLSSVMALNPSQAYKGWELYFSWLIIYLIITNVVTTERRFFVFMLAFLLYSFKMSQHGFRSWMENGFGFASWGATGAPGWFQNSGEFGIQMCIFVPLSVEFALALRPHLSRWARMILYLMPFTAIASMVASSSRGALVGGALIALWWIVRSKHRFRTLIVVAVVGFATWSVIPVEQKTRFSQSGDDETSTNRIVRWKAGLEMAKERPLLGIGYNNWRTYYGPLSHNIFIEAMSELGYTGLLAFLSMIGATFVVNARTRRLLKGVPTSTTFMHHMAYGLDGALIGFMASGFFVTVLYYPFFWINLAMTVSLHVSAQNEAVRLQAIRRHSSILAPRTAYAGSPRRLRSG
ncbi:MAG TPA: O-antigen ligase family protein [Longimicrobiales bacterium]